MTSTRNLLVVACGVDRRCVPRDLVIRDRTPLARWLQSLDRIVRRPQSIFAALVSIRALLYTGTVYKRDRRGPVAYIRLDLVGH